jgi:hypothetical protein
MTFDYVYLFENSDGGQYYGSKGQFTNAINRSFTDLRNFWDIPNDIIIRDCHGNIMSDVTKLKALLGVYNDLGYFGYPGLTADDIAYFADLLKTAFGSAGYKNYTHILLTFNALAAGADDYFGTPKKIIMGDGIMQTFADLGYGDVAPQAILAHEYGHHVQYANNIEYTGTPEGTRSIELMADAFAGYYLTSKRGAALNAKRVKDFLTVFFDIGDCSFDNPGHHGTPNQRMKAAMWGFMLADDAQKKGKIISSSDFIALFNSVLPSLVAPD